MVKVKNNKHYMLVSKRSLFHNLIIKATKLYDFELKVNWLTRTITLQDEKSAALFYSNLHDSRGVKLSVNGPKISVSIPNKLVECVD